METEFMGVAETLELTVLASHTEGLASVQAAWKVSEVTETRRDEVTAGKAENPRPLSPSNEPYF
jgi:hypothetical protein